MWARIFMAAIWSTVICATAANALELVTTQEAGLPDDLVGIVRGVTRGPDILLVSPSASAGLVKSPLTLRIRFKAHGGSTIDPESVVVTYKKIPAIDTTQRIHSYIRADGIEIPNAELPPGTHRFRIDVKDKAGRAGVELVTINVGK
jgi:hypothetical protein